jgi:hypothetical protein
MGIKQGSQTTGPRSSEKLPISLKLRPADHFSFGMWPSDQYEFETPGTKDKGYHSHLISPKNL